MKIDEVSVTMKRLFWLRYMNSVYGDTPGFSEIPEIRKIARATRTYYNRIFEDAMLAIELLAKIKVPEDTKKWWFLRPDSPFVGVSPKKNTLEFIRKERIKLPLVLINELQHRKEAMQTFMEEILHVINLDAPQENVEKQAKDIVDMWEEVIIAETEIANFAEELRGLSEEMKRIRLAGLDKRAIDALLERRDLLNLDDHTVEILTRLKTIVQDEPNDEVSHNKLQDRLRRLAE